ncbi:MAG TPA: hypothetical protein VGQ93_05740, partial [Lysobacter sp.]|nr:hypothetical protein [Lysobacter sp.]
TVIASPTLALMNLIALSTGLVLEPRRMWQAFISGTKSRNLYSVATRADVDAGRWRDIAHLRESTLEVRQPVQYLQAIRRIEFVCYAALAMTIHACIALPALGARLVTDIALGHNFFQAIKPKKRQDLY